MVVQGLDALWARRREVTGFDVVPPIVLHFQLGKDVDERHAVPGHLGWLYPLQEAEVGRCVLHFTFHCQCGYLVQPIGRGRFRFFCFRHTILYYTSQN